MAFTEKGKKLENSILGQSRLRNTIILVFSLMQILASNSHRCIYISMCMRERLCIKGRKPDRGLCKGKKKLEGKEVWRVMEHV